MNDNRRPEPPENDDNAIAIIGMAGRFPGAPEVDSYWSNLRDGVESITRYTQEDLLAAGVREATIQDPHYVPAGAPLGDMEMFDAAFFGFNPREGSILDPQHRHFLETCWNALEHSGHDPQRFAGAIGVFGGSGHNAYLPYNLLTNPELMESVGLFLARHTGNDKDFMTTRVSYCLDLKGPSVNVQTACSTSLVAIHLACQSLLAGECDMTLAGGVTIELPHRLGYRFEEGEILSPDGHCRAFDAQAAGTVFGSGVGVVVLRRLADALQDGDYIHALIRGSAVNNDGAGKVGYLAPSVDGQAACIAEALAVANVSAQEISYIETHGTGTPVGDPIEIAALTQAFRDQTNKQQFCALGSVKTNIGHLDTAAGVASLIKTIQALKHRQLPPSLHYRAPNPMIDFAASPFYVNAELRPWISAGGPRRAGISSLGVGGTNAHLIVEEAADSFNQDRSGSPAAGRSAQLVIISAKSEAALDRRCADLADYLGAHPSNLEDVCHTLQTGRQAMRFRRALVAESAAQLSALLSGATTAKTPAVVAAEGNRPIAFLFAGGGAQFPGMGADLYAEEPIYREQVDRCLEMLRGLVEFDPAAVLLPTPTQLDFAKGQIDRPSVALPLLFTTQYAQAALWRAWGIRPSAFIGHSMGEYTAACLAGVFSLEDALRLVVLRGQLFEQVAAGAMLSVPLPAPELAKLLESDLSIAAVNAPELSVASGPVLAIEALEQRLHESEIDTTRIHIRVAAHSTMLDPILETFREFWRGIELHPPQLPIASNLTGDWLTPEQATDPDYWVRHLRQPVQFSAGLSKLLADPDLILLEVGPGRTLATLARMQPEAKSRPILASQHHPGESTNDKVFMLGILGRLWEHGVPVDWPGLHGGRVLHRMPLPTYPFERIRHWIEPGKGPASMGHFQEFGLSKTDNIADWFYQPYWRPAPLKTDDLSGIAGKNILLFADQAGWCEGLRQSLAELGARVFMVEAADAFAELGDSRYRIAANSRPALQRLVAALGVAQIAIDHLVFARPLDCAEQLAEPAVSTLDQGLDLCYFPLLDLLQVLADQDVDPMPTLTVLTRGLQRAAGSPVMQPLQAAVLGPVLVAPKEFPGLRSRALDLPPRNTAETTDERLHRWVIAELVSGVESVVAYRGRYRLAQSFRAAPMAEPVNPMSRLRKGGVYLITGGTGGIGLELADYLARSLSARLILLSRSGLPARAEWQRWLERHSDADETSRKIRRLLDMEARGATVIAAAVAVENVEQLQFAIKVASQEFGPINGVFHTAGIIEDQPIQLKTHASCKRVLEAKINGTLALDQALRQQPQPLDFMVLFSSVSAIAGLAGQIDYAAGNAFIDAFAAYRMARSEGLTLAINWSTWRRVGMAARLARQFGIADVTDGFDKKTAPHPWFEYRVDGTSSGNVLVGRFSAAEHWVLNEHRLADGTPLMPGTGYLELLSAAIRPWPPGYSLRMREVQFLSPFAVAAGQARELRLMLQQSGDQRHDFTFVSRARDNMPGAAQWQDHVSGSFELVHTEPAPRHDPEAIRSACGVSRLLVENSTGAPHLQFGPRWNNLRRISLGLEQAFLELELAEEFLADLEICTLHPALLDMATAGAQELIAERREGDFYVPFSYASLLLRKPLPGKLFSHVRYLPSASTAGSLAMFDITVMDAQGEEVLGITRFALRRIAAENFLSAAPDSGNASGIALANNILRQSLAEGILPQEGMEALRRALSVGDVPQLVISTQNLEQLVEANTPAKAGGTAALATQRRAGLATEYVAPRSELEQRIAGLLGGLLGLDQVGIHDNFFEIGGHSLLAVRLFAKIHAITGVNLPLATLFEAPTVARMAEVFGKNQAPHESQPPLHPLAKDTGSADAGSGETKAAELAVTSPGADPWSCLVAIQRNGKKPPFFCVHGRGGNVLNYTVLAPALGPDQPLYGLQSRGLDGATEPFADLCAMARHYLMELRQVQPHGPYYLGGGSMGGMVALEMAKQLREAGEEVRLVVMFDTFGPGYFDYSPVYLGQGFSHPLYRKSRYHLSQLLALSPWGQLRYIAVRVTARLHPYWQRWQCALYRLGGKPLPHHLRYWHLTEKNLQALFKYKPGTYSGKVALLRARSQPEGVYHDPQLGWGGRMTSELRIIDIPGNHDVLIEAPELGQQLSLLLREHQDES